MKRYSWIVAFFFILLPLTSFAEEDAAVLTQTDCAVAEDGGVAFADGTLCEQDIAFGMLYEMFPAIFVIIRCLTNSMSISIRCFAALPVGWSVLTHNPMMKNYVRSMKRAISLEAEINKPKN